MTQPDEVLLYAPDDAVAFTIAGPPSDRGVIGEIRRTGGSYQPPVMRALQRVLRPRSVAFDVGANIGVFAVVMARRCSRGRVYAFEPALETYEYLVRNLKANGADNAVAEQAAAYATTGTVQFVFSPSYPPGSFVADRPSGDGETRTVDAIRIDDYVERQGVGRVDLIMVDAEGAELSVLEGAGDTIARHRPTLLAEMNPALLQRLGGTTYRELASVLERHHDLYAIAEDGAPARILSAHHLDLLLRRDGVIDLLCLARDRRPPRGSQALGRDQLAGLEAEFEGPAPPAHSFVVEPSFAIGAPSEAVEAGAGAEALLNVAVTNTSPTWFSSDSQYYPVHLSYRWYGPDGARLDVEANRARFDPSLAPGATQQVWLPVRFPPAPGAYELGLTLVQENYTWFDDLNPALQLRLPGTAR